MMPACERRFPALPVLTYPKVRSVPVLGTHRSRLGLTRISTDPATPYLIQHLARDQSPGSALPPPDAARSDH
ncbi:MAG: hypothetical protein E5W82_07185 [Mesorhizobium sp.]|nr:MAG: hypothetical protein E5W91_18485 [Mesorhizobium sp.]TIS87354.1 MAG: hypothetical protein E5W89_25030 [Mesorhizobium sp.]TJW16104.1 MAG: hypothetical protein E5W82_07185 [Mesorhizobium sp.]